MKNPFPKQWATIARYSKIANRWEPVPGAVCSEIEACSNPKIEMRKTKIRGLEVLQVKERN
ncbi:hypothetical protein GS501_00150 [Saccharibacter sp. 17.LH.SD]|uniref:hypothetical protein n=1 Tax=Saccharibacter sp. 17.LH.SD TaxID=2689393 RepID=UPI00136FC81B|nr:hypothetical protein [Saccharibacter sp. 17.LH.SD]MXV43492.1 hypothetical protein [Saccharibacter sp. 17.LH.SD]